MLNLNFKLLKTKFFFLLKTKIFYSTSIYTFSSLLSKAIPFILLPILTNFLTPIDYGYNSMFSLTTSICVIFTGFNTAGVINRNFYYRDRFNLAEYIFNLFILMFISLIIMVVLFYLFSSIFFQITTIPVNFIWAIIIISSSEFFSSILLYILQNKNNPQTYAALNIIKTLLSTSLSILFIVFLGFNWVGRIYAQVFTSIAFSIVSIYFLVRYNLIKIQINANYLKDALIFGLPLITHSLGSIFITMSDRYFITQMISLEETGLYSVAYQVGSIVNIFALSFNLAFQPWLYQKLSQNSTIEKLRIVKFTYLYFFLIILFSILLSLSSPLIYFLIIGENFYSSIDYVFWISIGYAFNGMYLMVTNYIFYMKKTQFLGITTMLVSIINLFLNYFLIHLNGGIGAAQATLISYILLFFFTFYVSSRLFHMPWFFWINKS